MYEAQKYGTNETFKWLSSKNAGETIVIVACIWSTNKSDWLYTVRYFSDGRFRRYTEGLITKHAVFTGVFPGDALKGASEAEIAEVTSLRANMAIGIDEASISQRGALGSNPKDALARVQEFDPFEAKPEPAKRLAKVYDIMDACAKKFGTDSTQFKDRMHWYDTIDKVGFKKAAGIL